MMRSHELRSEVIAAGEIASGLVCSWSPMGLKLSIVPKKSDEAPVADPGAPPEPPYKPYGAKPGTPGAPYEPYAKKPALPEAPYEPYKGM